MERNPIEKALSTDVVMDTVLRHLEVKDLLACRKVSKFWNKAASSVLRRRSTMIKSISMKKTLTQLGKCMKQSSDFPFVGLKFIEPWKFSSAGAMELFNNYGARFTRLALDTCLTMRLQELAPFINHLPRLSILEAGWYRSRPPHIQLRDSAAGQEDGGILNLPLVRTFRISSEFREGALNEDFLREVFKAASPSLRVECLDATYGILRVLKRVGKLQAVSVMHINGHGDGRDHALKVDELLSIETPALTKLDFAAGGCISRNGLMKLLISSQHTLEVLRLAGVCPSELLLECPVLSKLTTLSLCIEQSFEYVDNDSYDYVFEGSHGHKFPALKELKLDSTCRISSANLSDGLFIVPSLKTIHLDCPIDKAGIEELARSFPNVIEIQLIHYAYFFVYFNDCNPMDIWSVEAFEFLEKLTIWDCIVQWPTKVYNSSGNPVNFKKFKTMNMDSFLTGIPVTICEDLRRQPQQNVMGSPFNETFRIIQVFSSLKLKELTICVGFEDGLEELREEPPFISMVSVWYALQRMPNLQAKFVYKDRWVKMYIAEEDREQAVRKLKAVFKHVQPYVELEPFFY